MGLPFIKQTKTDNRVTVSISTKINHQFLIVSLIKVLSCKAILFLPWLNC